MKSLVKLHLVRLLVILGGNIQREPPILAIKVRDFCAVLCTRRIAWETVEASKLFDEDKILNWIFSMSLRNDGEQLEGIQVLKGDHICLCSSNIQSNQFKSVLIPSCSIWHYYQISKDVLSEWHLHCSSMKKRSSTTNVIGC